MLRFQIFSAILSMIILQSVFFCTPVSHENKNQLQLDTTATLSALSVSINNTPVVTDPVFHLNTINYTCQLDDTTAVLRIGPTATSAKATMAGLLDGGALYPTGMSPGNPVYTVAYSSGTQQRLFSLVVTAEDGSTQCTYSLSITWQLSEVPTAGTEVRLAELQITGRLTADNTIVPEIAIQPLFSSTTTSYTLLIDSATATTLEVHARPTSDSAFVVITVDGGTTVSGTKVDGNIVFNLDNSQVSRIQQIIVIVTAEDGKTKQIYSIDVRYKKTDPVLPDTVAQLQLMQVVRYSASNPAEISEAFLQPGFNTNILTYTITVDSTTVIGVRPFSMHADSALSVTLDGSPVVAEKWSDGVLYYTCSYQPGVTEQEMIFTVTAEDRVHTRVYTISVTFNSETSTVTSDSNAGLSALELTAIDAYSSEPWKDVFLRPQFHPDTLNYQIDTLLDTSTIINICPRTRLLTAKVTAHIPDYPVMNTDSRCFSFGARPGVKEYTLHLTVTDESGLSTRDYSICFIFNIDSVPPEGKECLLKDMPMVNSLKWVYFGRGGGSYSYHSDTNITESKGYPVDSLDYTIEMLYSQYMHIGLNPIPWTSSSNISVELNGTPIPPRMWYDQNEYYTCTLLIDDEHLDPQEEHFKITISSDACDTPTIYNYRIFYSSEQIPVSVIRDR